ncbi:MAG TPA: hypothetical protein VL068_05005 [Microthrixaceae bacterium]|nr:hypothetical protein [Microthrixaceae bacterium]
MAAGFPGGLVVAGGVEGECSEEFSGGCVDDPDVEFGDEQEDVGSGVGSSDADVVKASVVAQGDFAGVVDPVGSDAMMGVWSGGGRCGFGSGLVDGGWGRPVRD